MHGKTPPRHLARREDSVYDRRLHTSGRRPTPATKIAASLAAAAAMGAALALGSGAADAQQAGVRIQQIHCDTDPQTIIIENSGAQAQDLRGWRLKASGSTTPFDLTPVGTLAPGATALVEAGAAANATFVWSASRILTPGTTVWLQDPRGQTIDQQTCPAGTRIVPSTAPTPLRGPVPNGGGPPGFEDGGASAAAFLIAGSGLSAGGLVALSFGLLRPPPKSRSRRAALERRASGSFRDTVAALAVLLAAVLVLALVSRAGSRQ